jgi:hypothetical protein
MVTTAAASLLAHLTDSDIKPSVLSEPLKIFEDRSTINPSVPFGGLLPSSAFSAVPRGQLFSNQDNLPTNAYTFSYNPSSIGFTTSWDTSIPLTSTDGPLASLSSAHPASPENISFDLLLNRIVEASPTWSGANSPLFQTYGTLCDLAVLFRAVNGLTDDEIDKQLQLPNPPVPATNVGYLRAVICTVLFGLGDFTWSGYVTNLSITHSKFVDSMTPVLSVVHIDMTRTLAAGTVDPNNPPPKSKGLFSPTSTTGSSAKKTKAPPKKPWWAY